MTETNKDPRPTLSAKDLEAQAVLVLPEREAMTKGCGGCGGISIVVKVGVGLCL